jgi:hypothetical protein
MLGNVGFGPGLSTVASDRAIMRLFYTREMIAVPSRAFRELTVAVRHQSRCVQGGSE